MTERKFALIWFCCIIVPTLIMFAVFGLKEGR